MTNLRIYGNPPFNVAVVHGGPGAPGEMAPVARELSPDMGVLEPLQTATTVEGQVEELRATLKKNGSLPLTLIGFSWGAWLSYILAAHYPRYVKKLILVGSGAFEEKYAVDIVKTRLERLSGEKREEALSLLEALSSATFVDDSTMKRFGELMYQADSYEPLPRDSSDEILECNSGIYQRVWEKASEMRRTGELLRLGKKIQCPVVAIHGDYDPHIAEGVKEPLTQIIREFRFVLLEKCGHYPWLEHNARRDFFNILRSEIGG